MAKIPEWLINKDKLTQEDMDKYVCKNGSFTCGLLTKLFPFDLCRRCNKCKKEGDEQLRENIGVSKTKVRFTTKTNGDK